MAKKKKTEEQKRVAAIDQVKQQLGAGFPARGQAMLEKMGWSAGTALGAEGQGIAEPVMVKKKVNNFGLDYKPPKGVEPQRSFVAPVSERLTGANTVPLGERKSSTQLRPVDPPYAVQKFGEICAKNNITAKPVTAEQKLQVQMIAGRSLLVGGKPSINGKVEATPGFMSRRNVRKNLVATVKLVGTVGQETKTNATTSDDIIINTKAVPELEETTSALTSFQSSTPQTAGPKKKKALSTVKLVQSHTSRHTSKIMNTPTDTDEVTTSSNHELLAFNTNKQSQKLTLNNDPHANSVASPVKLDDAYDDSDDDIVWDEEVAPTFLPVSPSSRLTSSATALDPDSAHQDARGADLDALVDSLRKLRITPERTRSITELNTEQAQATDIQTNEASASTQQSFETPAVMRSVNTFWDTSGASPTPAPFEPITIESNGHTTTLPPATPQPAITTAIGDRSSVNGPPPAQPPTSVPTAIDTEYISRIQEAIGLLEDAIDAGRFGPTEERLQQQILRWYFAVRVQHHDQGQRTTDLANDGEGKGGGGGGAGTGEHHFAGAPAAESTAESTTTPPAADTNDNSRIEEAVTLLEHALDAGHFGPTEQKLQQEVMAWYFAWRVQQLHLRPRITDQADDGEGEAGGAGEGGDRSAGTPVAESTAESMATGMEALRMDHNERTESVGELMY